MTRTIAAHNYERHGLLLLEYGKKNEDYWMYVDFESVNPVAMYRSTFEDKQIREFCAMLNADPDLLHDFFLTKPKITVLSQTLRLDFSAKLGSKTYEFSAQIPRFIQSLNIKKNTFQ